MLPKEIHISEYQYELPEEKIALFPVEPRDSSKLLKLEDKKITHHSFQDISSLLPAQSLLVFNQTKVIQARLMLQKDSGAAIELLLLEPVEPSSEVLLTMGSKKTVVWECMVGNKKRWKEQSVVSQNSVGFSWENREKNWVRISWNDDRVFAELLAELGEMPIPPYLNRASTDKDKEVYQTVYAHNEGSVAAPTAGLHFTDQVFQSLKERAIGAEFITLHVGAGTFKPVSTTNALEHDMHAEKMYFTEENIRNLIQHNETIIPVGTTSMRSLESLYWFGVGLINKKLDTFKIPQYFPYENETTINKSIALTAVLDFMNIHNVETLEGLTSIYIVPGYQFRMCDGIITNFHQPGSTLMLLIAALIGDTWKDVYQVALNSDYRFLSYGDSSLLLANKNKDAYW
jgi:S-adenosylmethionine:tRNA ribosyltransferase-isomerase